PISSLRPVLLPCHAVNPHAAQALELDAPAAGQPEPFSGHELMHDFGNEDLTGLGVGTDSERGVHGRSEQSPFGRNWLARVDPDAYVNGFGLILSVVLRERPLDSHRALDGSESGREGRLDAI